MGFFVYDSLSFEANKWCSGWKTGINSSPSSVHLCFQLPLLHEIRHTMSMLWRGTVKTSVIAYKLRFSSQMCGCLNAALPFAYFLLFTLPLPTFLHSYLAIYTSVLFLVHSLGHVYYAVSILSSSIFKTALWWQWENSMSAGGLLGNLDVVWFVEWYTKVMRFMWMHEKSCYVIYKEKK